MFKKLLQEIRRKKIEPEQIEEELTRKPSGMFIVNYYADNGDFTVATEIGDTSEESASMLALLMMHMTSPDFESFLFESLRVWAEDDDDKIEFNVKTMLESKKLDNLVLDLPKEEDGLPPPEFDDVAVSASTVFNFKEMRQR